MRKFFILVAFAVSLLSVVPVTAHAQGMTLDEQRQEVFLALLPIQQDLRAQIVAKRAELDATTDQRERALLLREIRLLGARIRFIATLRQATRTRYSAAQLNVIINRYDLNVSLS